MGVRWIGAPCSVFYCYYGNALLPCYAVLAQGTPGKQPRVPVKRQNALEGTLAILVQVGDIAFAGKSLTFEINLRLPLSIAVVSLSKQY